MGSKEQPCSQEAMQGKDHGLFAKPQGRWLDQGVQSPDNSHQQCAAHNALDKCLSGSWLLGATNRID
jgi:hypothetical protein